MSDYTLAPCSTLLCGMQGSGKTTFAIRYLLNAAAACRFVFDFKGEFAKRLALPHASTSAQLEAALAQMGRAEEIELVAATQTPQKIHASLTGQATELVCFRLQEELALDQVEELGAERAAVAGLPLGSFLAWNRVSAGRLSGRVF